MLSNNFESFLEWFGEIKTACGFYPQHAQLMEIVWNDLQSWDGSKVINEQVFSPHTKEQALSLLRRRHEILKCSLTHKICGFLEFIAALESEECKLISSIIFAEQLDKKLIWLFSDQKDSLAVVITIEIVSD